MNEDKIVSKARETLKRLFSHDDVHEVHIPVLKPIKLVSMKMDYPVASAEIEGGHWIVVFQRSSEKPYKWKFISINK